MLLLCILFSLEYHPLGNLMNIFIGIFNRMYQKYPKKIDLDIICSDVHSFISFLLTIDLPYFLFFFLGALKDYVLSYYKEAFQNDTNLVYICINTILFPNIYDILMNVFLDHVFHIFS